VVPGDPNQAPAIPPVQTKAMVVHSSWNPDEIQDGYDIALLLLDDDVPNAVSVALAPPDATYTAGEQFRIVGWGDLESGGPQATNLMQGNVGFVPLEQCRVDLNEPNLDEGQMCALGTGYPPLGTDTCQGDSGGPMIKYSTTRRDEVPEQVGIVSWGDGCGQSTPGAYTSVSYYNGWINSYLRAWEKMGHVVRGDETGRGQRID
jgi:secreted trypsin-like serine protease